MDGARVFPRTVLAFALQEGWLEVLGKDDEFVASDLERGFGLKRAATLASLEHGREFGLVVRVGRRGRGGAFRWRATQLAKDVRRALLEVISEDASPESNAASLSSTFVTAFMAIVGGADDAMVHNMERGDLYAQLHDSVVGLPESARLLRVRVDVIPPHESSSGVTKHGDV